MRLEFKIIGLPRVEALRSFVAQELDEAGKEINIERARVVLEQQTETVPACRASVLLVVPGPDIHATGSDHTILAAWLKTRVELERRIKRRKGRRTTRHKSNLQLRASAGRV